MPSLEQHMKRDKELFHKHYREVHVLLDQFAHYPNYLFLRMHRRYLHHEEGIEYVRMRWGGEAAEAARQHVIDDCGHVPHAADYYNGNVNEFGQIIPMPKV